MLGELVNPVHRLIDSLRRDTARTLLMAAALGLVGWLVLYPLAILLLLGLHDKDGAWTLDNYRAVFTEPRLVGALANSVIVSAATLVVSLVLALPLAWGVARTRMPGNCCWRTCPRPSKPNARPSRRPSVRATSAC